MRSCASDNSSGSDQPVWAVLRYLEKTSIFSDIEHHVKRQDTTRQDRITWFQRKKQSNRSTLVSLDSRNGSTENVQPLIAASSTHPAGSVRNRFESNYLEPYRNSQPWKISFEFILAVENRFVKYYCVLWNSTMTTVTEPRKHTTNSRISLG